LSIWLAERHRQGSARAHKLLGFVTSVLVAIAAILVTTLGLMAIDSYLDADHLVLGYLLPTVVIAMHYGSTLAVLTSFASSVAAAYFLFPPKFSFYVSAPEHLAELGLFVVLAVTASKAVAVLTEDARERLRS
jgi:K+-sensing histidine kinase KdpD